MIRVTFHFYNILADTAGIRTLEKEFGGITHLIDAVQLLSSEYPSAFKAMLLADGSISNYLKIFLNGQLIQENDFQIPLANGDVILLFPAVSGG